ncbi:DUF262 domain-containing protein [Vibrio vulnificus]|uniref:DUF262 domain-containing protein n=1 Tax=Vibrio vulnificus TaxID=672 RepID=UPI001593E767|nr:DUF262 domain-containing protein [Vibrio vulnificus]EID4388072.1 DUF262 domain-containing protein [Vibrio vulnificus]NVC73121.1 DUF262 domain-containing protein [Vibrio vulnificus]
MSLLFNSDPKILFVTQLLAELGSGNLKIPAFQRPMVWEWQQQHDLLCSVIEGLPVGAILVWQTKNSEMRFQHKIGPFAVEFSKDYNFNQFLMDGLQRLSTLYCALMYDEEKIDDDSSYALDFKVYCDLDAEDTNDIFVQGSAPQLEKLDVDSTRYMPLNIILDSKKYLAFQRKIPLDKEYRIDKADEISSAFKNYKIPVVPLESETQEIVTKAFERINTRGTTMSEIHMVNALSHKNDFDLLSLIDELRNKYIPSSSTDDWKNIEDDVVLSIVKMYFNLDVYKKQPERLANTIDMNSLEKVFSGINKAASFSVTELGIDSPTKFPYKIQLICLCYAFSQGNNCPDTKTLKDWYLFTTYTRAFGGSARNTLNAVSDFKNFISNKLFTWTPNFKPVVHLWNKNVSLKNARFKAWVSALHFKKIVTLNTENISPLSGGSKFINPVRMDIPKKYLTRPGMNFLTDKKSVLFEINNMSHNEKEAHFISDEFIRLLLDKQYEQAASVREKDIFSWELNSIVIPASETLGIKHLLSKD